MSGNAVIVPELSARKIEKDPKASDEETALEQRPRALLHYDYE